MSVYTPTVKRIFFACLFLGTLMIFMPGSYSVDSYNYYYQFQNRHYSDWHSPVMAFVWYCLYKLTSLYEAIYIVQMAAYWVMGYWLVAKINKSKAGYWTGVALLVLFLFIPQYVMKDTQSVLAWGFGCLIMLDPPQDTRTRYIGGIAAILLLAYGLFVRINAIVAVLPLLYIYLSVYVPRIRSVLLKIFGVGLLAFLLMGINNIITYRVFRAERTYPQYKLMLLDITGISKHTGVNYLPASITHTAVFDSARLMQMYTPVTFDNIYWNEGETKPAMIPGPDEALNNDVAAAWKKAVWEHPFIYLENRWEGFLYYLRIHHRFKPAEYWNVTLKVAPENPMHFHKPHNSHSSRFALMFLDDTVFFDPWFWLVLNIGFLIYYYIQFRKKRCMACKTIALIQLSGVLYMLSQFPVYQHDRDFRYNYWNVIVFMIGIVYAIGKPAGIKKEQPIQ